MNMSHLHNLTPGPNTRFGDVVADVTQYAVDRMVFEYYLSLGAAQADTCEKKLQAISSMSEWQKAGDGLAGAFRQTIGPEAETSLVVEHRDTLFTPDLEIQKLLFSSMQDHWVTANLYLPRHRPKNQKLPAIICACGHAELGKASFTQRAAALALNGYATLVIDPVGQGERRVLHPAAASVQHNCIGSRFVLAGYNLAWMFIQDNRAAVSLLEQHDVVDGDRIGMTGSSGGGWLTVHAAALDKRIKVIAPAAAVRSYRHKLHVDDAEQSLHDMQSLGLDFPALLGLLVCPRPTLIIANEQDIWSIESTQYAFDTAKRFYEMQGKADHLQMRQWNRGHKYEPDQLAVAIAWFNTHLAQQHDKPVVEEIEPCNILAPEQCNVTASGSLYDDKQYVSPNRFFWKHVQANKVWPPRVDEAISQWREVVDEARGSHATKQQAQHQPRHQPVSPIAFGDASGQRVAFESQAGIVLPMDMIAPPSPKAVVMVLDELSHRQGLHRTAALLADGVAVCRPDLRGLGQTQPTEDWPDRESLASSLYSGRQRALHALAMTVGCDLVLERVVDLLAAIDVAKKYWPDLPVHVHASTDAQVMTALVAALVDGRIVLLKLDHHLQSLGEVMACDTPLLDGSSFLRGLLSWGIDLPDLRDACSCELVTGTFHDAMLRPITTLNSR